MGKTLGLRNPVSVLVALVSEGFNVTQRELQAPVESLIPWVVSGVITELLN
jgi:hypothetical protein